MAFRIDQGILRAPQKTATGIRADAYITRIGVFVYRNADGTERRELRLPEEVFETDSLGSFAMLPVTDDHPPEPLDPENATRYAKGALGENVSRDDDKVVASLSVFDAGLIKKMEAGKTQVSCGYTCDLEFVSGKHHLYGSYDAIQRNIRGNHIAIVDKGRAGPDVKVRLDAAEMVQAAEEVKMEKLQEQLAAALKEAAEQRARADMAEVQLAEAKGRIEVAEALALTEKARADHADRLRTDAASGFSAAVAARVALATKANGILKTDTAALSDRQIKLAVVKHVDGITVEDSRSDDFVEALYISALTRADAAEKSFANLRVNIQNNKQDAGTDPELAAKQQMIAANKARLQGV